mmetsp:Transcript_38216/g.41431  ORF Transcript_38216/g.41431 Transcript_38216/m.41431 type:complete len:82 (+) Transcript_38216:1915-2160(+)
MHTRIAIHYNDQLTTKYSLRHILNRIAQLIITSESFAALNSSRNLHTILSPRHFDLSIISNSDDDGDDGEDGDNNLILRSS